ncbi:MAG: ABC transporter permease [Candidatus Bathyarchaeota archaeon]|nr:ABC transporter permease [Candidatus Bathyarchaeota archaeon]
MMPKLTYRVWKVWRRNAEVFTKTIFVNFIPSMLEPILYLAAFGLGLGAYFGAEVFPGGASYIQFIAPGLISIAIMYGSFFECTYASFVRMYFQKSFDAIIATPISVDEVIAGETLWGATRATINSTIVLAVVAAFGLASSPTALLIPVVAFFGGLLFASLAMCFTALAPSIDFFNFPAFLFITPMFILSGTFFPIPDVIQGAALGALPLTHVVNLTRGLLTGNFLPLAGLSGVSVALLGLAWLAVATTVFFVLSIHLMKKRLIK